MSYGSRSDRRSGPSGSGHRRTGRRSGRRPELGNLRDIPVDHDEKRLRQASPIQRLFDEERLSRFARCTAGLCNGRRARLTKLLLIDLCRYDHLHRYQRSRPDRRLQAVQARKRRWPLVGDHDAEDQNEDEKKCRVATGEHVSGSAGEGQMRLTHLSAIMVQVRAPHRLTSGQKEFSSRNRLGTEPESLPDFRRNFGAKLVMNRYGITPSVADKRSCTKHLADCSVRIIQGRHMDRIDRTAIETLFGKC
jgi:hypothetical protein